MIPSVEPMSNGTYVVPKVEVNEKPIIESLNEKQRHLLLPSMVYLLTVMVFGTIGNILILYIHIVKRKSKSCPSYFIKCLAIVDLSVCAVMIPIQIYICMDYFSTKEEMDSVCNVTRWLMYGSVSVSCLVLTYVAYDRFVAICRPLQWYTKNTWKPKFIATLAVFVGFASQLTQFAVNGLKDNSISLNKVTSSNVTNYTEVIVCEHLYEYENYEYLAFILVAMIIFIIVSIFMTVSYCLIWRQIRRRRLAWKEKQLSVSSASFSTRKTSTTSFDSCEIRRSSIVSRQDGIYSVSEPQQQRRSGLFAVQLKHQEVICHLMKQSRRSFDEDLSQSVDNIRRVSISDAMADDAESGGIQRRSSSSRDIASDSTRRSSIETPKTSDLNLSTSGLNPSASCRKTSVVSFQQNIKMVRIFMCVTILLILTWTPFWILKLCSIIVDDFVVYQTEKAAMVIYFVNYLFYLNSAINPIVYVILKKQFRDDCIDVFNCCFCRSKVQN